MWTLNRVLPRVMVVILSSLATVVPIFGQAVSEGWLGGAQSPGFPKPLATTQTTFLTQDSPATPQALPGATPSTLQPNDGSSQSAPTAGSSNLSNWTLSANEFQAGIAAMSPGNFANTKYKWYGFVRLDSIFDFNPIAGTDSFVTSNIPVPQGRGQNAVLTPRYTRIGFDTSTPLKDLEWTLNTKIELDFFNGNNSGAFGSFPLRLRFAYLDFGPFRIGQAASLFMDYDVFPDVLDYQGPPGMVLMRQPIVSVKWNLTDRVTVAMGVEQPYSDISWDDGSGAGYVRNPGSGIISTAGEPRNVQDVPDLTGNVRYKSDYGHLQVAGIARKLTYQPAVEEADTELGYGVNVTGTFHPWAFCSGCCMPESASDRTPLQKSRFLGQYATGRGINRYIQDINGLGLDAVFNPVNNFEALRSDGWFVFMNISGLINGSRTSTYGQANTETPDLMPENTYEKATYMSANIIWLPIERMGLGLEYLVGERENKNGETGIAHRLQAGIQYKF